MLVLELFQLLGPGLRGEVEGFKEARGRGRGGVKLRAWGFEGFRAWGLEFRL